MIQDMIKWRPILIGAFIAVAVYIISDILSGQNLQYSAFLLAGIAVGFMIGEDIKIGILNGAIMGLIGGVIATIIVLIVLSVQRYQPLNDGIYNWNTFNIHSYRNSHGSNRWSRWILYKSRINRIST